LSPFSLYGPGAVKGGPCVNELMKALYCERKKDELKARLLKMGYFKTPDGRQLYELSLTELDEIFKKKLIERGK
ncbi:Fur-regulated basic protein FbpA, partial [Bacillus licheniformis]|uniref:Fur-regulated basic protein FbpA n=1 Tax=Bacillus licheniformis TaxID=1402 RepID=UPI003F8CF828